MRRARPRAARGRAAWRRRRRARARAGGCAGPSRPPRPAARRPSRSDIRIERRSAPGRRSRGRDGHRARSAPCGAAGPSPSTVRRRASVARSSGSTSSGARVPLSRASSSESSIAWAIVRDLVDPDHARAALDRVGVAEQGVDRIGGRVPRLEREQRLDHAVQALGRLLAEDLEDLGVGLAHARAAPPRRRAQSRRRRCRPARRRPGRPRPDGATRSPRRPPARSLDAGDRVHRQAGAAAAMLGDHDALGASSAREPEARREVDDRQHLAAQVAHAEHRGAGARARARSRRPRRPRARRDRQRVVLARRPAPGRGAPLIRRCTDRRRSAAADPLPPTAASSTEPRSSSPTRPSTRSAVTARCGLLGGELLGGGADLDHRRRDLLGGLLLLLGRADALVEHVDCRAHQLADLAGLLGALARSP